MKKRIIITALSVMLASSSIIPAHAAEPLPEVERTFDLSSALNEWADKHVEECNKISDPKERYKYIVQLVSANLNLYTDYQPNEDAMLSVWKGDHQTNTSYYVSTIVHLASACGLESYVAEVYGNNIIADGRTNFMPSVYFEDNLYITSVQNIERGDNFDDFVLMPNGKYGVSVTEDPREAYLLSQQVSSAPVEPTKFSEFIDPYVGVTVIYDSDGSALNIICDLSVYKQFNGTDRYYVCENATLRPVTEEQMVSLGYVKQ